MSTAIRSDVAVTPDGTTAFVTGEQRSTCRDHRRTVRNSLDSLRLLRGHFAHSSLPTAITCTSPRLADSRTRCLLVYDFNAHTHALIRHDARPGPEANGITFNPINKTLYLSSEGTGSVYEIDTSSDLVLRRIPVGPIPQDIPRSPPMAPSSGSQSEGNAGVQVYDLVTGVSIRRYQYITGIRLGDVTRRCASLYHEELRRAVRDHQCTNAPGCEDIRHWFVSQSRCL